MEPATVKSSAASTMVGTNTARELNLRYSTGSTLTLGARRGHAPLNAVA